MNSEECFTEVVVPKEEFFEALVYYLRAFELRVAGSSDIEGIVTLHLTGGRVSVDLTAVKEGYEKHRNIL